MADRADLGRQPEKLRRLEEQLNSQQYAEAQRRRRERDERGGRK